MEADDTTPIVEVDDKTLKRLERAWRCILEQFSDRAQSMALERGVGISLFRMLRGDVGASGVHNAGHNERSGPSGTHNERPHNASHNCEHYYAEKDSARWFSILTAVANTNFIKTYDPETMYAICVSVPVGDVGEESVESIKLFRYDTRMEVEY